MAESVPFNVDQFKSKLVGGGARPNQFYVQLTFPPYVSIGAEAAASAPFLVTAASLPGSIVNPAVLMYRGREVKLAGERVYNPWTVNIINSNAFEMRSAFEQWSNAMNNYQDNSGEIHPFAYMTDLSVTQLDRNSRPLKQYVLRDAFPIDVSEVQLDFGANDQISQFSVTFSIQDMTTNMNGPLTKV